MIFNSVAIDIACVVETIKLKAWQWFTARSERFKYPVLISWFMAPAQCLGSAPWCGNYNIQWSVWGKLNNSLGYGDSNAFTPLVWGFLQLWTTLDGILKFRIWLWRYYTQGGNFSQWWSGLDRFTFLGLSSSHQGCQFFHNCVRRWFGDLHCIGVWLLHTRGGNILTTLNSSG